MSMHRMFLILFDVLMELPSEYLRTWLMRCGELKARDFEKRVCRSGDLVSASNVVYLRRFVGGKLCVRSTFQGVFLGVEFCKAVEYTREEIEDWLVVSRVPRAELYFLTADGYQYMKIIVDNTC